MRGCGTVFRDDPAEDRELYEAVEAVASQMIWRAEKIRTAIAFCRNKSSTEGLIEMVAYAFNAQQFTPSFGGGTPQLPPGKGYKVVIVNSGGEDTKNGQGGFIFVEATPVEGQHVGKKQVIRFNVHNTNPKTVEIAQEQLSALSHVLGKLAWQTTEELHNIPFMIDVDWQKGHEPSEAKPNGGYTEVTALYDVNGRKAGEAANGPQQLRQGGQQGGGFGGQQQGQQQGGGFGQTPGNVEGTGNVGGFGQQQQGQQQGGFAIDNNVQQPGGNPTQQQNGGGFGRGQQHGGGFGGQQPGGGWSQGQGNGQGWGNR